MAVPAKDLGTSDTRQVLHQNEQGGHCAQSVYGM